MSHNTTMGKFLTATIAVFAAFFAYTPSSSWQDAHFSDEPAPAWPEGAKYVSVPGAQGLVHQAITAGPAPAESKGVIVFCHGFPETARSWLPYISHYAAAGYHVLAPDLRNVNNTVAPNNNNDLSLDLLADDLLAVVKSTGQEKAIVVGHDWGAGAAWAFALKYPAHAQSLVSMSVPHLELYRSFNVWRLPYSVDHEWYFLFFGLTGPVARWKAALGDFGWFTKWGFGTSDPGAFSKAEVASFKSVWERDMASATRSPLTGWYWMGNMLILKGLLPASVTGGGLCASMWSDGETPSKTPTLQLFGGRDNYINPSMFGHASNKEYVAHTNKRTVIFDATHWVNHEKKTECMAEMDSFFAGL